MFAVLAVIGWRLLQKAVTEHPQSFPWTELSLQDPVGRFTAVKLSRLSQAPEQCLALLRTAGMAERPYAQPAQANGQCRFEDGVQLRPEDGRSIRYNPSGLVTSCPVAAGLALWEREVVQPAALRHFGTRVTRIDHGGSFSCRRLYGRSEGRFSEHATADAIDIMGFRLEGGQKISVLDDWKGSGTKARFLRDVRDGACDLFSTVLSPDYNAAHADHFHFDQAERGSFGWTPCR